MKNKKKKKDKTQKSNIQSIFDRTSVSEYLSTVKMEYQFERNKKISFENRAGIMLTVYGGLAIIIIDKVNFRTVLDRFTVPLDFLTLINILSGISTYVLFSIAILFLSKIVSVDKYINFNVEQIDEDLLNEEKHVGAARIALTYKRIIMDHRLINELKAQRLKDSIRIIIISLITLLLYIITK